jgi:prepilin-type N-terminal cleavage/methylation domain-containing protein
MAHRRAADGFTLVELLVVITVIVFLLALRGLRILEITPHAVTFSCSLIRDHVIPPKAVNDALHIALAAVHGIHYLLAWNCAHLANAERVESIVRSIRDCGVSAASDLHPPRIDGPWTSSYFGMTDGNINPNIWLPAD